MTKGFVNILKPSGMTSSDVVVKVRGILKSKTGERLKVGHLGTLDPAGAGVLPIAVGSATKLFDFCTKKIKHYRAGIKFGQTTDTLDSYGKLTIFGEPLPTAEQIEAVIPQLVGQIMQVPPQYSALSINGVKAYKMARSAVNVELPARQVNIFDVRLIEQIGEGHFVFDVVCEGGTYIRSIARDIGLMLNSAAYMSFIIRLKSGEFEIEQSVTLENFEKNPLDYILPIEFFTDKMDRFDVPSNLAEKVENGVKLQFDLPKSPNFTVYTNGLLLGIGAEENGFLVVKTRL